MIGFEKIGIEPRPFERPRFRLGRGFNSKKYAGFKRDAGILLRLITRVPPMEGPLSLSVFFFLKRRTVHREFPTVVPDIDNFLKAFLDVGNGVLWVDDCQVIETVATKLYARSSPGIAFRVKPFNGVLGID